MNRHQDRAGPVWLRSKARKQLFKIRHKIEEKLGRNVTDTVILGIIVDEAYKKKFGDKE